LIIAKGIEICAGCTAQEGWKFAQFAQFRTGEATTRYHHFRTFQVKWCLNASDRRGVGGAVVLLVAWLLSPVTVSFAGLFTAATKMCNVP